MCAGYWEAYDNEQCDLDPQYAPFCAGYRFEQDVGYFVQEEEFDYESKSTLRERMTRDRDYHIENMFNYILHF